jgi:hypothetical protein
MNRIQSRCYATALGAGSSFEFGGEGRECSGVLALARSESWARSMHMNRRCTDCAERAVFAPSRRKTRVRECAYCELHSPQASLKHSVSRGCAPKVNHCRRRRSLSIMRRWSSIFCSMSSRS